MDNYKILALLNENNSYMYMVRNILESAKIMSMGLSKLSCYVIFGKMASQSVRRSLKEVKPILSLDREEARKRVLNLYKAWHRQIPYIVKQYDIPRNEEQCRLKLREYFCKHDEIKDIRVIDMLIIKGQMELKEIVNMWKQKGHVMTYFKDTIEPKPQDFLSKFLAGNN